MVYDFEEGRILGELNDLDDEIQAMERVLYYFESLKVYERILIKLQQEKEHLEMRLKIHRQKVKESGIKY